MLKECYTVNRPAEQVLQANVSKSRQNPTFPSPQVTEEDMRECLSAFHIRDYGTFAVLQFKNNTEGSLLWPDFKINVF